MDSDSAFVAGFRFSYCFYVSQRLTEDQLYRLNDYINDGLYESPFGCEVPLMTSDVKETLLS